MLFMSLLLPAAVQADRKSDLPAFDTVAYSEVMEAAIQGVQKATFGLAPLPRCNFTYDERMGFLMDGIEESSSLSFPAVVGSLPDIFYPLRPLARLFQSPISQTQAALNTKSLELSESNNALSGFLRLISVTMGLAQEVNLSLEPIDEPDLYEIICTVTYFDGRVDTMHSGIHYNEKTEQLYGSGGNGLMGLGYDYDAKNKTVYTTPNTWHDVFGYNVIYDFLGSSEFGMFLFDTRRIPFHYKGEDWQIQIWKGRYSLAGAGGEIGVYKKPVSQLDGFYNCVGKEDYLSISMRISRGDRVFVDRPAHENWWVTGFNLTDRYYRPEQLTLESDITLKDQDMLKAFCDSLDKHKDITYTVDGLTVNLVW